MAKKSILTAARLREVMHYDPATGNFTRLKDRSGRQCFKRKTGTLDRVGNRFVIHVDYDTYLASRLAWLWMTGTWPRHQIDHINRNSRDNRWANLRDVTQRENQRNKGRMRTNTSGVPHISFNRRDKLWVVHFSYVTKREAVQVVKVVKHLNGTIHPRPVR